MTVLVSFRILRRKAPFNHICSLLSKAAASAYMVFASVRHFFFSFIGHFVILRDEWKKKSYFKISEWSTGSSNKIILVKVLKNLLIAKLDDSMSGFI